jgi:KUP system potassium uptake protein
VLFRAVGAVHDYGAGMCLAVGHRSLPILTRAILGVALSFGDAIITPAISVPSAMLGAKTLSTYIGYVPLGGALLVGVIMEA